MISKKTKIKCLNCGIVFHHECFHGGSIEHDNIISNMSGIIERFEMSEEKDKDWLFMYFINLNGNFCNIENNHYIIGMEIFECCLKWLKSNNYTKYATYLESRKKDIKTEYIRIKDIKIKRLQEKIDSLVVDKKTISNYEAGTTGIILSK